MNNMTLIETVQKQLKAQKRSMAWLAGEMNDRSPDGLRYALVKGGLNYNALVLMARVLNIQPATLFEDRDESSDIKRSLNASG